jgi:heat shock protein HtpX
MAAAFGLYTHIQSNRRRSIALLLGLFFLVYVMVYAGALLAEAMMGDASLEWLLRAAFRDLIWAAPWATLATALWIAIAYLFNQSLIDAVTGASDVTRKEQPRLYNLLENLCISRGIPMPKLKVMDDPALNAFASGLNPKQYSITVTTGLLNHLNDQEVEAVLGHELTHIRNGDVRMLVIAVIIAGVIGFFAELVFRMFFHGVRWSSGRSSGGSSGVATLDRDPLRTVAAARVSRRRRSGRAHQEPRCHDHGAAQDRGPRRARPRDLRGHGDVRRQSARGLRGFVRDASLDRKPDQGPDRVRRRP